jgi:uncharacterized membrane protein
MARRRLKEVYQRIFFDRLLLVGIIFLSLAYILRNSWGGAFTEAAAFVIGILWSYRAATTNPSVVFRLLAALMMILIGSLLAIYLGAAHGLI